MMSNAFTFYPDKWFGNRALRMCSPAARALWVDILCLCSPEGRLLAPNGSPMSEKQIATLVGMPVLRVKTLLEQLGKSGIYDVDEYGLFSSMMVGGKRSEKSVAKPNKSSVKKAPAAKPEKNKSNKIAESPVADNVQKELQRILETEISKPKRTLAWWEYPAGWIKQGASQAISMNPGETFDNFQVRLAARIPPGPHLEVLSSFQRSMYESIRPKGPDEGKPS